MISGRLMTLARLDILILLHIDTRCSLDKRTSKWYGNYTQKWFFTQVHSFVMLVHSNQRQSAMQLTYPDPCRGGLVQYECISELSDLGRDCSGGLVSESPPAAGWSLASCNGYEPAHLL